MRRLTFFLRRGLFVVGVVLLVCVPVSLFIEFGARGPVLGANTAVGIRNGTFSVIQMKQSGLNVAGESDLFVSLLADDVPSTPLGSMPRYQVFTDMGQGWGFTQRLLFIPLWLLAGVCLAWPVTSFFLHRRRPGQGFGVEPAEGMEGGGEGSGGT